MFPEEGRRWKRRTDITNIVQISIWPTSTELGLVSEVLVNPASVVGDPPEHAELPRSATPVTEIGLSCQTE